MKRKKGNKNNKNNKNDSNNNNNNSNPFAQITYWIRIIIPEGQGLGYVFQSFRRPPPPTRDIIWNHAIN